MPEKPNMDKGVKPKVDEPRLPEEKRLELRRDIAAGKAVLDEIERILANDGVDNSEALSIYLHVRDLCTDLRKIKEADGLNYEDAQHLVGSIANKARHGI